MAVKDTINNERVAVRIITVDPAKRRIEAALRSGGMIQIRVWDTPSLFRWPEEGEVWLVQRKGLYWELDSRVENNEDGKGRIEDIPAGATQIHGTHVKMGDGRDVVVTDESLASDGSVPIWQAGVWVPGMPSMATAPSMVVLELDPSTDHPVAPGSLLQIPWDIERIDTDGYHAGSSPDIVMPTNGIYLVTANVCGPGDLAAGNTGPLDVLIALNSGQTVANVVWQVPTTAHSPFLSCSGGFKADAGDILRVYAGPAVGVDTWHINNFNGTNNISVVRLMVLP